MRSWALSLTFSGFYQLYFTSHDIVVMVRTKIFGQPPFRIFVYKLYLIFLFLTGLHFTLFELSDKTGTLTRNEMVLKMWVRDGHVCSVEEVVQCTMCISLFIFTTFYVLFVSCFANVFLDFVGEGKYQKWGYIWKFFTIGVYLCVLSKIYSRFLVKRSQSWVGTLSASSFLSAILSRSLSLLLRWWWTSKASKASSWPRGFFRT